MKKRDRLTFEVTEEIRVEAARLDLPISKLMQWAWTIARDRVRRLPSAPGKGKR